MKLTGTNIMLNLATMGTTPSAVIIAIGAVVFDTEGATDDSFYARIDLNNYLAYGRVVVPWWLGGPREARQKVTGPETVLLISALQNFSTYLQKFEDIRIWGNGPSFDNVILRSAYRSAGMKAPWKHSDDRCYRTAIGMLPGVHIPDKGAHHNALDNALDNAVYRADKLGVALKAV